MAKTSVILLSDQHINSRVALCKRIVQLDDGGSYRASRTQNAILEAYKDFCDEVGKLESRKILFLNGDTGELDAKKRGFPIVSHNKADIRRLMLDILEPIIDVVDKVIVVRGTQAHTGKSAWIETVIAEDMDNTFPSKESASWWHFRGTIEGVRFDVHHKANMGRMPWTEKHAGVKIAKIVVDRYNEMKSPIPHIAARAHNHKRSDSGRNFEVKAICMPCWSGFTEFAHQMGYENDNPSIGGDVIVCEDGKYEWIDYRYHPLPEGRRVWSIKI